MGRPKSHILVVDDEPLIRSLLQMTLQEAGFSVDTAADGISALKKLGANNFDLVVMDVGLNNQPDGIETVRRARNSQPSLRTLFISGSAAPTRGDPDLDDFVKKPFAIREFTGCVLELLYRDSRERWLRGI
jgi:DNA-binding response OmpR family regulator